MLPPVLVVLTAACALLGTAVVLAGPAAAIEDPRRPSAEVTHGPSCGPAVVRVQVTNGTQPRHVALLLDGGTPDAAEQDSADLAATEQAELTSADVDWGQTVDVSITVTDQDGTTEAPIELGTYTRPSAEDCAAISSPTPSTGTDPTTSAPTTAVPSTSLPPATGTAPTSTSTSVPTAPPSPSRQPAPPARPTGTTPGPGTPRPTPPAPSSSSESGGGAQAGGASAASVSPGGVVTLRASGFTPGEVVTVTLLGTAAPLTTVTAQPDGSVEAVVQIPRDAALGSATVQLVGGASAATTGLDLQVAAREQPLPERTTSLPVFAAGIALIGAAAVLGLTAARRSRGAHTRTPR